MQRWSGTFPVDTKQVSLYCDLLDSLMCSSTLIIVNGLHRIMHVTGLFRPRKIWYVNTVIAPIHIIDAGQLSKLATYA